MCCEQLMAYWNCLADDCGFAMAVIILISLWQFFSYFTYKRNLCDFGIFVINDFKLRNYTVNSEAISL